MASENTVKIYGHIVEWNLKDSSSVVEATGALAWYSTAAPAAKNAGKPDSTNTWWNVKTITYVPTTAQATGDAYVRLYEKDSSGPILFHVSFQLGVDAQSQTYNPPLRCRPYWHTTGSVAFTTGGAWVFQLA